MSVLTRPPIVTNGLVLHLDAANRKSYPGTGTTWFDMSGNQNNVSIAPGFVYKQKYGGTISFEGVSDTGTLTNFLDTAEFTFEYTILINDLTGGYGQILINGAGFGGDGFYSELYGTAIGGGPVLNVCAIIGGSGKYTAIALNETPVVGKLYFLAASYKNRAVKAYRNGVLFSSATTAYDIAPATTNKRIAYIENIEMYQLKHYNRALTDQEVLQNYNATKARFGL